MTLLAIKLYEYVIAHIIYWYGFFLKLLKNKKKFIIITIIEIFEYFIILKISVSLTIYANKISASVQSVCRVVLEPLLPGQPTACKSSEHLSINYIDGVISISTIFSTHTKL